MRNKIPDSQVHLTRNYVANFKCACFTYEIISLWICKKSPGQTFQEYISEKHEHILNEKLYKKWLQQNKENLDHKDFSEFDVTFLHELLPILSDGEIAKPGIDLHKERMKNTNSLEYLLYNIKDFRNKISHKYKEACKEEHIHNLKDNIHKCLKTAGEKFKVPSEKISVDINKINQRFNRILAETYTYKDIIDIVTDILKNKCFKEMQRRSRIALSDYSYSKINSNSSYYDIELSTENQSEENNKDVFLSSKFLSKISEKVVVIKGPSGSGKSTLMRALYHSVLNKTEGENGPVFEGIERFKFPLSIECRCTKSTNLVDYLKEEFPDDLGVIPKDEIINAIRNIEGLVFLIDGIDETDQKSKKLIGDVISISKNLRNVSCIVTGRVEAANEFITNDLSIYKLDYADLSIEPFEYLDQKLKFLKIYDVSNLNSDKLKKMKPPIQKLFSSPMLLVIFHKIHLKNNDISNLKNERSLYDAIYLNYLEEITRKMQVSGIENPISTANDLIHVVCKYSFELLSRNRYFVNKTDYLEMVGNCKEKTIKDVDIEKILTCILSPGNSSDLRNMNYYFEHSSIQEYLAVKWVHQNVTKNFKLQSKEVKKKNLELFLGCLSLKAEDRQLKQKIKRYKFIIRLLIFEILADENMPKFQDIIVRIFHDYIGPDQHFYMELMRATNCDEYVVQMVTGIAPLFKSLRITRYDDLHLIERILSHAKSLKKFFISLNRFDESIMTFVFNSTNEAPIILSLELKFSYYDFRPMKSKFYSDLDQMRDQLSVDRFKACLEKTDDLRIVVGKMKSGGHVDISTRTLQKLDLSMVQSFSIKFSLMIKYSKNVEDYPKNPTPENTYLRIRDVPEDSLDNLLEIIKNIAPNNKTFSLISLLRCKLTNSNVEKLLQNLFEEGIRTKPDEKKNKNEWISYVKRNKFSNIQLILIAPN